MPHLPSPPPPSDTTLVQRLAKALTARRWRMAAAESCTGGGIASACTDLAGSSDWFERGWVTYSNQAKRDELDVPAQLLDTEGAVSEAVARAMAEGAARNAGVTVALSVTGVAGPGGGTDDKPVGTVWFGWHLPDRTWTECRHFSGERTAVRQQAVHHALSALVMGLEHPTSDPSA